MKHMRIPISHLINQIKTLFLVYSIFVALSIFLRSACDEFFVTEHRISTQANYIIIVCFPFVPTFFPWPSLPIKAVVQSEWAPQKLSRSIPSKKAENYLPTQTNCRLARQFALLPLFVVSVDIILILST